MSHALCQPRWMGHGGEFWQNVVHWRREWKTTSVFLPWESHEQYKRKKDRTLKEELPKSIGAQYATGDQWRNNSRKIEETEQSKNNTLMWLWLVMEVKSNACKEHYCLGTWNVRSMNRGKLKVVKQEMARVNIKILTISELKWSRMGKFNSDDYYI